MASVNPSPPGRSGVSIAGPGGFCGICLLSSAILDLAVMQRFGDLSPAALILTLISAGLAVYVLRTPAGGGAGLRPLMWVAFAVVLGITNLYYIGIRGAVGSPPAVQVGLVVGLTAVAAIAAGLRAPRGGWALAAAGVLWVGLVAATWGTWGSASIDVFHVVSGGSAALLHGTNPYGLLFNYTVAVSPTRFGFAAGHFAYGPIVPLLAAPGWLLGDVRSMSVVAVAATAMALWVLARQGPQAESAHRMAALALVSPLGLGMIWQAWVEVYLVAGVVCWLAMRRHHRAWAVGALTVALLVSPITLVVLAPAFLWSHRARLEILIAAAAALVYALPFIVATGVGSFFYDILGFQFTLPMRYDGLTLTAYVWSVFQVTLPGWLPAIIVLLVLALFVRRGQPSHYGELAVQAALMVLATFVAAKWAFFNYYYIATVMLMAAAAGTGVAFAPEELAMSHFIHWLMRPLALRDAAPEGNDYREKARRPAGA